MAAPIQGYFRFRLLDLGDFISHLYEYRYDKLHMFDLQNPATTMCWMNNSRICVIGSGQKAGSSEILELSLPSKLLVNDEGMVKDRDFDVCSGIYCQQDICSVCRVSDQCVVTSEMGENLIRTWKLGDDTTGTIKLLQKMQSTYPGTHPARLAAQPGDRGVVLFGNTMSELNLVDLDTETVVCQPPGILDDEMCMLEFIDENTFVACSQSSGDLWSFDLREGHGTGQLHAWTGHDQKASQWACDLSGNKTGSGKLVVRMSDQGALFVSDLTLPKAWLKQNKVQQPPLKDLQIRICPSNSNIVSTTDAQGNVLLHNTTGWTACLGADIASLFRHEGHWVNSEAEGDTMVRTHMWHPSCQLVISAATDGSLHAWKPAIG